MIYLTIYDISKDSLRTKIAKRLIADGHERIQLSVFLGLESPKKNTILWNELQHWLALESHAKLYVIPITESHFRKMNVLGDDMPDIDYLTGKKHTLFI